MLPLPNQLQSDLGSRVTAKAGLDPIASGLLKDKIVLDNPERGQLQSDTTLLRRGALQTIKFDMVWNEYAVAQNEPPVVPAYVVQVPNTPSDTEMLEWLEAIFDSQRSNRASTTSRSRRTLRSGSAR